MFSCRLVLLAGAVVTGVATLGGCATTDEFAARFAGRWGPPAAIPESDFNSAIQGQVAVLAYIAQNAGLGTGLDPVKDDRWYSVAEWGFNVGRQDCEVYLDNLYRLHRERLRNDGVIAAFGTAASAIVTSTTTKQRPLSIIAAVFGLTTALNDAILDSYLFNEAPGLIAIKIKDLQDAYKDLVKTNQKSVNSSAAAYEVLQNYYTICLPPSIEGVLLETVASGKPQASNPGQKLTANQSGGTVNSLNAKMTLGLGNK